MDCCVVDIIPAKAKTQNYVLAAHIPIRVGYKFNDNFKYYFGQN